MKKTYYTFKEIPFKTKIILYAYSICFLFGGIRHWIDILRDGIFPYQNIPFIFNFYLTSLAIFDLIVIVMFVIKPINGLVMAVLIMLSDLIIDFYLGYNYWNMNLRDNLGLQLIVAFSIFLFFTAPILAHILRRE